MSSLVNIKPSHGSKHSKKRVDEEMVGFMDQHQPEVTKVRRLEVVETFQHDSKVDRLHSFDDFQNSRDSRIHHELNFRLST